MTSATPPNLQDSPLLSLPAELRNHIYDLLSGDFEEAVIVAANGKPTFSDAQHPLSRTCRQLRVEFSSYAFEAAQISETIKMRCKNFDMPDSASMLRFLRALPPLAEDTSRQYLQRIIIDDNDFVRNISSKLENLLANLYGSVEGPEIIVCSAWIQFDIENMELDSLVVLPMR